MILAGDVGGTKVHLALYRFEQGALRHVRDQKFPAAQYPDLQSIVREFLGGMPRPANPRRLTRPASGFRAQPATTSFGSQIFPGLSTAINWRAILESSTYS